VGERSARAPAEQSRGRQAEPEFVLLGSGSVPPHCVWQTDEQRTLPEQFSDIPQSDPTEIRIVILLRRHFLIICAVVTALAHGSDKSAVKQTLEEKTSSEVLGPTYGTAEAIKAMPPVSATFAKRISGFSGSFRDAREKTFVLGDRGGEQAVWHFVNALKEGQTYKLPEAFVNYQAAPSYVTAKDIAAMPACTAVLAARSPCSSSFMTPEGKWFGIGDPSSGAQISRFIWSLRDEETNRFPDVFLAYQAAPRYVTAKEITEMRPCTAVFVRGWDDSGYFKTPEGKGLLIGKEPNGKELDGFLRTLEEGKTYDFPNVFLKYQR
jgi:hypothetical protein